MNTVAVVTCEHASNRVPRALASVFSGARGILTGHRGWDPGALEVARSLARQLDATLFVGTVSRLVVDLNRSRGTAGLLSAWTRSLPRVERDALVDQYWLPFRNAVRQHIDLQLSTGARVAHLSVHSFTPRLGARARNADVGLLYDPTRPRERSLADAIAKQLRARAPELRIRRNYPYRGVADGHTTALRRSLPASRYVGLELELSQALLADAKAASRVRQLVTESIGGALAPFPK